MQLRVAWMSVLLVMLAIGVGEIRAAEYEIPGERSGSVSIQDYSSGE
ncbi:MAG: hypothetical protein ACRERE_23800 [Candidatus Entotheonellia bacterium]